MTPLRTLVASACCTLCLLLAGTATAKLAADPAASKTPVNIFRYPLVKACADVQAELTLTQGANGLVTLAGRVSNLGKEDYMISSVAEVIMNLGYAPHYSFARTGVSELIVTRPFGMLRAGDSITIDATYQIPDFGGWATADVQGDAKRLFTLRVIKRDMSSYKAGEDCNTENNVVAKALFYRALKH